MKKLISLLLSVLLVFSVGSVAFAQTEASISLNEAKTIALASDEEVILKFTPPEKGNYKVTVAAVERACIEVLVYCGNPDDSSLGEGAVITTDKPTYKGISLKPLIKSVCAQETEITYLNAKKGREISISIKDKTTFGKEYFEQYGLNGLIDLFTPSEVTVTVEKAELENVKPGDKHHFHHKDAFEFTPDRHGKYRFKSILADGADPEIKIFNCDGYVDGADNTDLENLDFDMTVTLDANETYIVECGNNSIDDETFDEIGTFDVEVEEIVDEAVITAEIVSVDEKLAELDVTVNGNPDKIRFVKENGGTITLTPESANVNSVIKKDTATVWNVTLPVQADEQLYYVFAKFGSQWNENFATVKVSVPAPDISLKGFDIVDDVDGVIYQGVNKLTFTTGIGVTKIQLMKNGNTWTYSDPSMYEDINGLRVWNINMNFTSLGEQTFDIRVRGAKTAFSAVDKLDVLVFSK